MAAAASSSVIVGDGSTDVLDADSPGRKAARFVADVRGRAVEPAFKAAVCGAAGDTRPRPRVVRPMTIPAARPSNAINPASHVPFLVMRYSWSSGARNANSIHGLFGGFDALSLRLVQTNSTGVLIEWPAHGSAAAKRISQDNDRSKRTDTIRARQATGPVLVCSRAISSCWS